MVSDMPRGSMSKKESANKLYIERLTNTDFTSSMNELYNRKLSQIEVVTEEKHVKKIASEAKMQQPESREEIVEEIIPEEIE